MNSAPEPPPAPDPVKVAKAQTATNIDTGVANKYLNLPNQSNPFWTSTATQSGGYTDPTTGKFVPSFTQNFGLSPLGNTLLGQVGDTITKPLDFSGANNDYINAGPQALNDQAADAYYKKQAGFLDPDWTQKQRNMEDQLSRQGIPIGSEAYNSAMTNFNNSRTQAYDAARTGATATGADAASKMFGMALQGQNQNITQQQLAQTTPLKNLGALIGAGGSA